MVTGDYILFRYTPSQADVQVFGEVGKAPAASLPHALRWYNHIASYTPAERKAWAQGVSPLSAGAKPTAAAPAKKDDDDDDDVDLFGSGDEEEVCSFFVLVYENFDLYFSNNRLRRVITLLPSTESRFART